jgi:hypothetical protein
MGGHIVPDVKDDNQPTSGAAGLFRKYESRNAPAPEVETVSALDFSSDGKKNYPTPSRKEIEAAKQELLHPKLTKKEKNRRDQAAREKMRVRKETEAQGQPERRLMRDYVDSRWNISEFVLPVLIVLLALSLVASQFPKLTTYVTIATYGAILVAIANVFFSWSGFKTELWTRYPGASTKGLLMGMISRMLTIRAIRNPRPLIERGDIY